ncbi:MAG: hypothetical protein KU38_00620 [Sulfurovum sp. FS08-3]|nr:MAG: hypothetical protein KU38_00620 [Sulfurovum sp. FS08-3]
MKEELQKIKNLLNFAKREYGNKSIEVVVSYSNIGAIYTRSSNYSKAIEYYNKALKILRSLPQSKKVLEGFNAIYTHIGETYTYLKQYEKAKEYLLESIKFSEAINDIYAEDYNHLIICYLHLNEPEKALEYFDKDLERISRRTTNNKEALLTILANYMSILTQMQKFDESREYIPILEYLLIDSAYIQRYKAYKMLSDFAVQTINFANSSDTLSSVELSYQYMQKAFNAYNQHLKSSFEISDNQTKQNIMDEEYNYNLNIEFFASASHYVSHLLHNKSPQNMLKAEKVNQDSFNVWINYKGEISNFNTMIAVVEAQTDNQLLKKNIKKWKTLKIQLSNLYQDFNNDRSALIESIEKEISHIESELSNHSTQFKEFMGLQNLTYKDIASYLKPNQLYVDFVSMYGSDYIFILDNECNISFKTLFLQDTHKLRTKIQALQKELQNKEDKRNIKPLLQDIYQIFEDISYSFDTKSLFDEFKDKTDLIISPNGLLNFIPFEALHDGTSYLIESKTISYVSNAKEFIKEHRRKAQEKGNGDIVVFANPHYDMKFGNENRGVPPLLNQSFGALEGTQKEADTIKGYYPNAKVYTQQEATVENLMSVQNPKILHIATHGFYLEDENMSNSLQKSGLALSGAAQAKKVGDTRGIVTALSLSALNLAQTDLVVLSACETG